jgi:hypothetical protein
LTEITKLDKFKQILGLVYFALIYFITEIFITLIFPETWDYEIVGLLLFIIFSLIWLIEEREHKFFDKILITGLDFALSLVLNDVYGFLTTLGVIA